MLRDCATEPIHIPGRIQPHGVMIVATDDGTIVQVSANASALIGEEPDTLLGRNLQDLLAKHEVEEVRRLSRTAGVASPLYHIPLHGHEGAFDAIVHRSGTLTILELQPSPPSAGHESGRLHALVRTAIADLRHAAGLDALCDAVTAHVAELTGFDRVMVYRFDDGGDGEVVAERVAAGVEPYLGLRYPASDIPAQARELYRLNPVRLIPDVAYEPTPLVPPQNPVTGTLDMSLAVLRSVSPVHVEYLKNMEVAASLSLSLLVDGKLWGLIACHHRTPRRLPYEALAAAELLAQVASAQIESLQKVRQAGEQSRRGAIQAQLVRALAMGKDLHAHLARLAEFVPSGGVVVYADEQTHAHGQTPSPQAMRKLLDWLEDDGREPVVATHLLGMDIPAFATAGDEGALGDVRGLLAIRLSHTQPAYVMWFRPEVVRTVTWAGDPRKPVNPGPDRLHPRRSFEAWQETVRGCSEPWTDDEVDAAAELRLALMATALRRAEERVEVEALRRSNESLEAFTSIVSHDLREPLGGIKLYASLLERMPEVRSEQKIRSKLDTIALLTRQMEGLIGGLMEFARVGTIGLAFQPTDLNTLVRDAAAVLQVTLEQRGAEVHVNGTLPTVLGDATQLKQVLYNLVLNGVKYNDKPRKRIEIGLAPAAEHRVGPHAHVLYVRDNGVGIAERDRERVFQIFTRLGGKESGDGTGVGLPIVRKIIERHGGQIWLDSEVGVGTTFYFTLPRSQ